MPDTSPLPGGTGAGQPVRNPSFWTVTEPAEPRFPRLEGDLDVDVCVVGAGITGLTTALLLAEAGVRVAVLEGREVASGTTGSTTAKVTSNHGLAYTQLLSTVGADGARTYAEANQTAVQMVRDLAGRYDIDGDLEDRPAITFTTDPSKVADVRREAELAASLGLPASFEEGSELPLDVVGAVRYEGQLAFHPRRYCLGLAEALRRADVPVFERTWVHDVSEEKDRAVVTAEGGTVTAGSAVLATLLPIVDAGGYFVKCHPVRSYSLVATIDGEAPSAMHLGADEPTRTLRAVRLDDGGEGLLVGGRAHRVGEGQPTQQHHDELEAWAREHFPIRSIEARWSAHDQVPVDHVPYVGRSARRERTYVATGFRKWGLSNGTAAAAVLAGELTGDPSPWASLYDATRVNPSRSAAKDFVKGGIDVGRHYVQDTLQRLTAGSADHLGPGEGGIVDVDGQKVAAHRDDDGQLHAVTAVCTHLACTVQWNDAERSWDCPCHGSRFATDGRVLCGPATEALTPVEVSGATTTTTGGDR